MYSNLSLLDFLKNISNLARFRPTTTTATTPTIYVLGNPSSDLDSIISAIVYSYFASLGRNQNNARQYIPLINLPDVKSGTELRRLRPEFITALGLATQSSSSNNGLSESVLTTADFKDRLCEEDDTSSARDIDVFMVDWNALPLTAGGKRGVDGISGEVKNVHFSVVGCIDHHEDEHFVPEVEPRVIQTGVGSCTSLVVRELRARTLWAEKNHPSTVADTGDILSTSTTPTFSRPEITADDVVERAISESQVAKLALAAILADTANMTAESKVSDVDREAVSFLEDKIAHAANLAHAKHNNDTLPSSTSPDISVFSEWNRRDFYDEIMHAKSSSVENLTIDEVLGRDYKEWVDTKCNIRMEDGGGDGSNSVKIGICNVVKPLPWVIKKAANITSSSGKVELTAESYDAFFTSLEQFARARELDVVALMTVYTTEPDNEFHRELLVWALDDAHLEGLRKFEASAVDEFDLTLWADGEKWVERRLWTQKDVSRSRKQVAPLLRKAMTGCL